MKHEIIYVCNRVILLEEEKFRSRLIEMEAENTDLRRHMNELEDALSSKDSESDKVRRRFGELGEGERIPAASDGRL